jgi:hypothetical protein
MSAPSDARSTRTMPLAMSHDGHASMSAMRAKTA